MGDPRVAQGRRWRVLWVHHEAEELRVHDRAAIPDMTADHVIGALLASGQVARMNAGWWVTQPPGAAYLAFCHERLPSPPSALAVST